MRSLRGERRTVIPERNDTKEGGRRQGFREVHESVAGTLPETGRTAMRAHLLNIPCCNTGGRPLSEADLFGRAVLVLFFDDDPAGLLAWRETVEFIADQGRGVLPCGVFSPEDAAAAERETMRKMVRRLNVPWPVAADASGDLRAVFAVPRLPLAVLLDPDGNEVWRGEPDDLPETGAIIAAWRRGGLLDTTPFVPSPEEELRFDDVLHFPEAVAACDSLVVVADTGAHRLMAGRFIDERPLAVVEWIVGKTPGFSSGAFAEASFFGPRGLAFSPDGSALAVADSLNHAVRLVDLEARTVRTLPGFVRLPTAVAYLGETLFAAAPCADAILRMNEKGPEVAARVPGVLALAGDGERLWFLDGVGGIGWFDPGNGATGALALSRPLVRPAGLCLAQADGLLLCVAETGANAVATVDPATGEVKTRAGKGRGYVDGFRPRFFGPRGIAAMSRTLFVADTSNHALRAVSLAESGAGSVTLYAAAE